MSDVGTGKGTENIRSAGAALMKRRRWGDSCLLHHLYGV